MYLSVAILKNGRHLGFSIGHSDEMNSIIIEMAHATFGACIINSRFIPKCTLYLLHCDSVTTYPKATVTLSMRRFLQKANNHKMYPPDSLM